jgi:2',3'-cyclic-nucleotide 2'-phosphodiesterase (5'-nucleotidase family)
VIGLTTLETPATTSTFNDGTFPPYKFLEYAPIVQERSSRLRQAGANAVIILSHVGNDCDADNTFGMWEESTPQKSNCNASDEIAQLLKVLPKDTIDGVVQGHRHKFSHHFIHGVPVMGTISGGYYFNILYLRFYDNRIFERIIEGPVPVCERVFKNLGTCGYLEGSALATAGNLAHWDFHGHTVRKHSFLEGLFTTKWLPLMAPYLEALVKNEIIMTKVINSENDLGNLATNLMNAAVPGCDVVILNAGGFRTTWVPGIIQYQHFHNMFPFSNIINSFDMTGQELINTLTVLQSGVKGFYPTYGLSQVVSLSSAGARRFISAKLYNGSEIVPTQNYRVLSLNFLTQGGDDFKGVIGKVYTVRNEVLHGEFKALVQPKLVTMGTIKKDTLVDPLRPRLQVIAV